MFLTIIKRKNQEFFFHFTFKFISKNGVKKFAVFSNVGGSGGCQL